MSIWSPTHVQFTVLRARNLVAKGKGGNNDVFATIQLGKEKFQTSTIKNALNPEWFEECDLPIPHMHTAVEVTLFHRGLLSDDFLGYAAVPVWEHKVSDPPQSSWVTLKGKPASKSGDKKYRGELEIKLAFHCHSRGDLTGSGQKKRTPSIRNLATAFGERLKFTRSRSFRENHRRDPEGGKVDLGSSHNGVGNPGSSEEMLTRSYSMSTAYIKAMTLDRGPRIINNGISGNILNDSRANHCSANSTTCVGPEQTLTPLSESVDSHYSPAITPMYSPTVTHLHSQSLYSLPGNRHSCIELPPQTCAPPPYFPPSAAATSRSQDDTALALKTRSRDKRSLSGDRTRTLSEINVGSGGALKDQQILSPLSHMSPPSPPPLPPPLPHHRLTLPPFFTTTSPISSPTTSASPYSQPVFISGPGIYESIKERTEPENSFSSSSPSSSDNEGVVIPRNSRVGRQMGRTRRANVPVMGKDGLTAAANHKPTATVAARPNSSSTSSWLSHSLGGNPTIKSRADPAILNNSLNSGPLHLLSPNHRHQKQRPNSFPNFDIPPLLSGAFKEIGDNSISSRHHPEQQEEYQGNQLLHHRLSGAMDSGIIDDRSSSLGANSLEGSSLTTSDCMGTLSSTISASAGTSSALNVSNTETIPKSSHTANSITSTTTSLSKMSSQAQDQSRTMMSDPLASSSSLLYHLDRELLTLTAPTLQSKRQIEKGEKASYKQGSSVGTADMVVRKRSRGERDRLRQMRQGQRRFSAAEVTEMNFSGPKHNGSPGHPESGDRLTGLMAAYGNMSKEDLLRVVIQSKAQMIRKDQYIRDLETYIDDLLVRVMETTPPVLNKPNLLKF